MESDNEDVDVIFEDSVLHQALIDCGFTSVETESKATMEKDEHHSQRESGGCESKEAERSDERPEHLRPSIWARLVFSSDFLSQVHHYHRHRTLQRLISSALLSSDDRRFLQDFVEEPPPSLNLHEDFTVWTRRVTGMFLALTVLFALSPAPSCLTSSLVPYVEEDFFISNLSSAYLGVICVILVSFIWFLCVLGCMRLLQRKLQRELLEEAGSRDLSLHQLESEGWELLHLERKCLRLLRESELVARGFTLATQQHASSVQSYSQRSTIDRLCPQLRRTMLTQNTELLSKIKAAVVNMMKSVVMRVSESDFGTLEGPPQYNALQPAQGDTDDDVIALAPISKSVSLLQIYISGCMRRLALCFYQRNLKEPALNPFEATLACVLSCTQAIRQAYSALREQHTYYRAVHRSMAEGQSEGTGALSRSIPGTHRSANQTRGGRLQDFYVCVNSLDLHLQSVLLMTRDVSSALEAHLDEEARKQANYGKESETIEDSVDTTDTAADSSSMVTVAQDWSLWEDALKRMKTSLDSVRCCYEESLKQLHQKDKTPENQSPEVSDCTKLCVRELDQAAVAAVKMIPAEDPVIIDQVFEAEAVVDDARRAEEEEEEEAEWRRQRQARAQNRAKVQEHRETMKRLRQELGAVVGHRALIQREREERALARARGENFEECGKTQSLDNAETKGLEDDERPSALGLNSIGAKVEDGKFTENMVKEEKDDVYSGDQPFESRQEAGLNDLRLNGAESEFKVREIVADGMNKDPEGGKNALMNTSQEEELLPDVFKLSSEDCKPSRDSIQKDGGKDLNFKKQPAERSKFDSKASVLERMRLGADADPSSHPDFNDSLEKEIVPGIPYSFVSGPAPEETKSLGVEEKLLNGEDDSQEKSSKILEMQDDTMSDSSAVVKNAWKRPAPPRICRRNGTQYVVPVNLITVGVVLQGGDGDGKEGGGSGGGGDDKGGGGSGGGGDRGDGEDDKGTRRRRHSSHSSKSDGGSGRRRRTSSNPESGLADEVGAVGGYDPRLPPTVEEPVEVYGKWGDVEKARKRREREMKRHWSLCELELLKDKVERFKRINKARKLRGQEPLPKSALTSTPLKQRHYSLPAVPPVCEEGIDDGGPDPDLVGGLRFSPEDFASSTASGGEPPATPPPNDPRIAAQAIVSPWLRKFRDRVQSSPSSSSSYMRSRADIPLAEISDSAGRVSPDRFVSWHASRASGRFARDLHTPTRRCYSSQELRTDSSDSPWLLYRNTAPPEMSSTTSDRIVFLSSATATSSTHHSAAGASSLDESSDAEQWVKITRRSMVGDNGSEFEVIRQKEIRLENILAPGVPSPVPSPQHNSSFNYSLAKMAAAQARRVFRSENMNILGTVEKFGDASSSDEDGLL